MADAVVTAAVRTTIGTFGGALKDVEAHRLGGRVIESVLQRSEVSPAEVDEVVMGSIYQGGAGPNLADRYGISREAQDDFAMRSQERYRRAQSARAFDSEIVPVDVPQRKGDPVVFDVDEHPRKDASLERLSQLKPAFKEGGSVTAGNASGIRGGAAIVPVDVPQRKGDPVVFDVDEHPRKDASLERLSQLKPAFKEGGSVTAGNASGINDGGAAMLVMSQESARSRELKPLGTSEPQRRPVWIPRSWGSDLPRRSDVFWSVREWRWTRSISSSSTRPSPLRALRWA